jgi:uridine kinase
VDGIDGAGKTTFADELAAVLRDRGHAVIRALVDGFHNPREVRYRRGRRSAVGYYLDSFDYDRLRRVLLDP